MINLQTDILDDLIRTLPRVMVMFGTDWCGNCDILKPEFLKLSHQKEYREIPFVFVNPDDFPISRKMVNHFSTDREIIWINKYEWNFSIFFLVRKFKKLWFKNITIPTPIRTKHNHYSW